MKKLILMLCFLLFSLVGWADTIIWDAPIDGGPVGGYTLYWGSDGDDFCTMSEKCNLSMPSDVLSVDMTILNLLPGNEYKFIVTAYNATGESGPSNEVVYTEDPYQPPLDRIRQSQGIPTEATNMTIVE